MSKYTIKIEQDEYPESPREWDNLGTMACGHRDYNLGDEQLDGEQLAEFIKENGGVKQFIMLPLYLYDHSGITMNTAGFSCQWDSGQVGYIYVSRADVRKEWGVKRISPKLEESVIRQLVAEVETYDQYLQGNVFGYIIEDKDGDSVDSCWGFYGFDYCEEEAKAMVEYLEKEDSKLRIEKIKAFIRNHVPLGKRQQLLEA